MPNPDGINGFSGPGGEREPAYGAIEREKTLTSAVPIGGPDPEGIPKRSQRRAVKGAAAQAAPAPPTPHGVAHAVADGGQRVFWESLLNNPEASPLTKEYAQRALGG